MNAIVDGNTRRLVFADVVAEQDRGSSVLQARETVAAKHQLSTETVKEIEREGIEQSWPPLGE